MWTCLYIDQEWLIEHREGVIVLSGGTQGDIAKNSLKKIALKLKVRSVLSRIFPDHFYLSLSRTDRPDEERYIQAALKLAEMHDLPLVRPMMLSFLSPMILRRTKFVSLFMMAIP